eukprot:COSAG02_NODE_3392_length_6820_cov_6.539652_4_plen_154_part_00
MYIQLHTKLHSVSQLELRSLNGFASTIHVARARTHAGITVPPASRRRRARARARARTAQRDYRDHNAVTCCFCFALPLQLPAPVVQLCRTMVTRNQTSFSSSQVRQTQANLVASAAQNPQSVLGASSYHRVHRRSGHRVELADGDAKAQEVSE